MSKRIPHPLRLHLSNTGECVLERFGAKYGRQEKEAGRP